MTINIGDIIIVSKIRSYFWSRTYILEISVFSGLSIVHFVVLTITHTNICDVVGLTTRQSIMVLMPANIILYQKLILNSPIPVMTYAPVLQSLVNTNV